MTTLTQRPVAPSPALELYRMNVHEYERLAAAGVLDDPRVELIDGYLVRKMTKKPPHVIALEGTRDALLALFQRGWRVMIQDPVRIPDFDEPEPDIALVRGSRQDYSGRHPNPQDIGLIIEVADSSLDIDRREKLQAYARGGIPVYWIINLVDGQVEVWSDPDQAAGWYRSRVVFAPGDDVPVIVDGREVGRIAVADLLP
jgi:Uma2 family endonuclease